MKNQGKGSKIGGNKVIVRRSDVGQYRITIPRAFAEAILLQDKDVMSFQMNGRDSLILKKEKITLEEINKLKEEKKAIKQRLE